jgi:Pyruvate/2-oxoacid:ferredoxin oxidoreductase gamma subunit
MSKTLIEISEEYRELVAKISELDGELTPDLEKELELNKETLSKKADAYMAIIKAKDAKIAYAESIKKQAEKVIKQERNQIEFLRGMLFEAVKLHGSFKSGLFSFTKAVKTSISVKDLTLLPKKYIQTEKTITANMEAIKEALKEGIDVKGVEYIEKEHLVIN